MVIFLKRTGLCLLVLLASSCGDSDLLKFDNLEGIKNWVPDYKLQLAYANYDVWRLIEQTDNGDSIIVQKDNQIFIRHFQKNIASLEVSEVIELPKDIAKFTLKASVADTLLGKPLPENLTISLPLDSVPLNFEDGDLTRIEGKIACRHELLQYSFNYEVTVEFMNIFLAGTDELLRFKFPSSEENENPKDVIFDMASSPNQIKWKAYIKIKQRQIVDIKTLNIGVWFKDFSFTRVEGTMKTQKVEIKEGEFDMDVEFWDNFEGSFNFADPKVDLIVRNYGLAVPVQMDMDFVAYGENGKYVGLETKNSYKPTFEGWIPGEGERVECVGYDTTNSNIAELLSLPPKEKIAYSGRIIVAPGISDTLTVLNTGKADVDAYVEIPLYLNAKNLVFRDTIDDIDISDADKIKEAKLIVRAVNQIPLGLGSGYLYLLDDTKNCIDSVKVENFLEAPEINEEGDVIVSDENKEAPIAFSEENILHLNDTKYIVISVEATTSKGGEVPVVIKADATLNLKLILEAKLNLEDIF